MVGQKNVIVFLVACAFALYQFRNAKNRADLSSPTFQMKKAKQMITNHLNMFDHKVYDAKTGRGGAEEIPRGCLPENGQRYDEKARKP